MSQRHAEITDNAAQSVLLDIDTAVARHDDADVVTHRLERFGQRAGDIGQAANLGEGSDLGGDQQNLQRLVVPPRKDIARHTHRDRAGRRELFHGLAPLVRDRHHFDRLAGIVPERVEGHGKGDCLTTAGTTGPARLPRGRTRRHRAQLQLEVPPAGPRRQAECGIETEVALAALRRTAGKEDLELDRSRPIGREQIESQVEVAVVVTEPDPPHGPLRGVHRAEERADVDVAASLPLLLIHLAVEPGCDLAMGPLRGRSPGVPGDRLIEVGWGRPPQRHIDVAEMEPKEAIPDLVHPRIVRSAEPPEPVAALRDERLAARQRERLGLIRLSLTLPEKIPCLGQQVPGDVVFLVADPGVEVRVDPGARINPGQRALGGKSPEEFRNGHCFQLGLKRQPAVQRMEERVAVALVRIPAVFAVQGNDRQERRVRLTLLDGTKLVDEVAGCLIGGRILVLEANRVREPGVAKEQMNRRAVALYAVRRVEQLGLRQLSLRIARDRTRQ